MSKRTKESIAEQLEICSNQTHRIPISTICKNQTHHIHRSTIC